MFYFMNEKIWKFKYHLIWNNFFLNIHYIRMICTTGLEQNFLLILNEFQSQYIDRYFYRDFNCICAILFHYLSPYLTQLLDSVLWEFSVLWTSLSSCHRLPEKWRASCCENVIGIEFSFNGRSVKSIPVQTLPIFTRFAAYHWSSWKH